MTVSCVGYVVNKAKEELVKWNYTVRDLRPNDCEVKVLFSGICHTDLHFINDDWNISTYPMVPGHEIVGEVIRKGSEVPDSQVAVGDFVGIGCMVWSCRTCKLCLRNEEQYCPKVVLTYGFAMPDGECTYGGYSNRVVAPFEFCVKIPKGMDLIKAAPLLCAGITCWSPMKYFKMDEPGKQIGVIGLGGLGHMAVKFGRAFENQVTVISTSRNKEVLAKELGADRFVVVPGATSSGDPDPKVLEELKEYEETLDFIIDTVSAEKPMSLYMSLLRVNGILVTVGLPEASYKMTLKPTELIWKRKSIAGSVVGSTKEMQEMMKFCSEKNVYPMVECLPSKEINTALSRLAKNDVKFRFVLDMKDVDETA